MFDLIKAVNIVENALGNYQADAESQPYRDNRGQIEALELVLGKLNDELHAQMLTMDLYAVEMEQENA